MACGFLSILDLRGSGGGEMSRTSVKGVADGILKSMDIFTHVFSYSECCNPVIVSIIPARWCSIDDVCARDCDVAQA
jgi:hypothetical protein